MFIDLARRGLLIAYGLITEEQAANIQPVIQITGPAKNYLHNNEK